MTNAPVDRFTPRFGEALAYADHMHRGQTRKGSEIPCVAHLLSVSALVIEHGGDEALWTRFSISGGAADKGREKTLWYYDELVKAFQRRDPDVPPELVRALRDVVEQTRELVKAR